MYAEKIEKLLKNLEFGGKMTISWKADNFAYKIESLLRKLRLLLNKLNFWFETLRKWFYNWKVAKIWKRYWENLAFTEKIGEKTEM